MISDEHLAIARQRMQKERNIWMATTRPDGRPHVAPLWFIWYEDRAYVMTGGVKLANIQHNGFVALNTEDGDSVVIVEGTAQVIGEDQELFATVAGHFQKRYGWDIRDSLDVNQLIEVTPVKVLAWNT